MKSQPTRIVEPRQGKLHMIRKSDGKVYCVLCHRYRTIQAGNCCDLCLERLGSGPTRIQMPLANDGIPGILLNDIRVNGMVQGRKI